MNAAAVIDDGEWMSKGRLDAEILIEEAVHAYGLTLMVAIALCVHRLLLPRRRLEAASLLPVMLWGLQSALFAHGAFFGSGHWRPGYLLFLIWLIGIVTFGVLGLLLALAMPGAFARERGHRVVRVRLRAVALTAVVVATVFLDWTLISIQVTELSVMPALQSVGDP